SYLARWRLDGPVERWRLRGMSPFDSIHDIKASEHHLVFTDLPFVFEPQTFRGAARSRRNQEHTNLWIVAKEQLRTTPPGGEVTVTEVTIPMPTGHLTVDYEEVDGLLRVVLQQIPLSDLMVTIGRESVDRDGRLIDPNYEGLVALAVQPSVIGRYLIDPATGTVVEKDLATDERMWGGILAAADRSTPEARRRQRQLWYAGVGYDPALIPSEWWELYGEATDGLVAPGDLPAEPVAGSVARIDLEAMKVAEVHVCEPGSFPSPPTFVPRRGATTPDDGYLLVVLHKDGPKEIQVFDANDLESGPVARVSSSTFNPNLLLHSCWMPDRVGPRRSTYKIPLRRDLAGAIEGVPGVLRSMKKLGPAMAEEMKKQKAG
ncbi:MAG: carotenoid oxygenase family protein, partial [Actinomycetota bacterium]|nr:carotenoid oxygenase family protein [Actinomycetota bacterium]